MLSLYLTYEGSKPVSTVWVLVCLARLYLTYEGSKLALVNEYKDLGKCLYLTYEGSKPVNGKYFVFLIASVCILPMRDRNRAGRNGWLTIGFIRFVSYL